jgi:hypothetical protein
VLLICLFNLVDLETCVVRPLLRTEDEKEPPLTKWSLRTSYLLETTEEYWLSYYYYNGWPLNSCFQLNPSN